MSTLASAIGSGAGVVAIAVALLVSRHLGHFPGFLRSWIERGVVILMYCAGAAIAVTTLGSWTVRLLDLFAGPLGGINAAIPRTAVLVGAIILTVAVVVSLVWEPNAGAGMTAAFLPILLGMVSGGFLHQLYVETVIPGQAFVSALSAWIGG